MLSPRFRVLTIACGFAVVALLLCAGTSFGQCASCAAPVYAAPAVSYQAYYAPWTVAAYRPVSTYGSCNSCGVPAYQPVAACNSCSGYAVGYGAVTTYRPLLGGWTTRMVPYAAYRPVYASPVAYTSNYAPCASCNSVVAYSPCTSCSTCSSPCSTCSSPCNTCGTTSGCASCSATSYSNETPAPAGPQKTFQEKVEKPVIDNNLKPQPDTHLDSMRTPVLQDTSDRVTSQPVSASPRVELTARRVPTSPVMDDDGWQASKD